MKHLFTILLIAFTFGMSQAQVRKKSEQAFVLKGIVVEAETNLPIPRVNVEIDDGAYTTTNGNGEFSISAEIGDEISIRSDAFKPVYYTVKDEQNITVKVQKDEREVLPISSTSKQASAGLFERYIDSAKATLREDANKSISYVTKAIQPYIGASITKRQTAIAFETLGDINLYWDQPDLAVDNFKRSISESPAIDRRIKLANAFRMNKNYQESIAAYKELLKATLGNYQKVEVYEGLGDTYKAINDPVKSVYN